MIPLKVAPVSLVQNKQYPALVGFRMVQLLLLGERRTFGEMFKKFFQRLNKKILQYVC